MTIFSPHTVGSVARRRSTCLPAAVTVSRPSWGSRRSEMSTSAMIFRRLVTPELTDRGARMISCSTPSMRNRTRRSRSPGSRWMSDARSCTAWVMSRLTKRTMGASSTTSGSRPRSSSAGSPRPIALVRSSSSTSLRW